MDTEAFVRWALDAARTVEERYTTELLVEQGVQWWNTRHEIYRQQSLEQIMERNRQRALNPAYQPRYSEESLRKTAEVGDEMKSWWHSGGLNERPIRDLTVLRFLQNLDAVTVSGEVSDLGVLTELPRLRTLSVCSRACEDFRPLARCRQLRELGLIFWRSYLKPTTLWPDLSGLEELVELETLTLEGNL